MQRTRIALAAIMLSAIVAGTAQAGGQASVTILKAPKGAVAGQTFEVAFTAIPEYPMDRNRPIQPIVKAVCGDRVVTLDAVALKPVGHYKAELALPTEGEWVITVDSRFCHTKMKPLRLKAAAAKGTQT